MKYSNAGEVLYGTRQFDVPGAYLDLTPTLKSTNAHHAREATSGKNFIVTIDPNNLYTLGVSTFSLIDIALGIRNGIFGEGTEFMSPDGRVRIMGGKLKYAKNKALYKLPEIRV